MPLSDWRERYFSPLQNLLTFATGVPNALVYSWVRASRPDTNWHAQVWFRPPYGRVSRGSRSGGDDSLFLFPAVRERWGDICRRWLALYANRRLVRLLDAYLGGRYHRIFRPTDFSHLVQAVEVYHQLRATGDHPGLAAYQAKRAAILGNEALSDDDRAWLRDRVPERTQPNLRTRLTQLLEQYEPLMHAVVPDREAFVDAVNRRRNELAHQGPPRSFERGSYDIWQLSRRLEFLLQACFLHEVGFDDAEIAGAVRSTSAFCFFEGQ
jgi:hypothetical protein